MDRLFRRNQQDIYDVIDVQKWQLLQDSLSEQTGMAIITTNYMGVPVTVHSGCRQFCELVRADSELLQYCQKCDSRGGLEASRINKPYLYLCHFNILDAAVPILADGKYIGAVMVGQVVLDSTKDSAPLEPICFPSNRAKLERQTALYEEYYNSIPHMSLQKVNANINMLSHLCHYIVEEAKIKNLALDICARMAPGDTQSESALGFSAHSVEALENVKQKIDSAITNAYVNRIAPQGGGAAPPEQQSILAPAIAYIEMHKDEKPSLKKIAALCHISPSYFCKLFLKEMGENYSTYLLKVKIEHAKELLETTDKTVFEIASSLGFSDSGHFVRNFKKMEGTTPGRYRVFTRSMA